ncbi:MAG: YdiU family protein [Myxococcales bacterium]|nr:YdiU family protein [Myxococcales bacterium]
MPLQPFENLPFDDLFVRSLPGDPSKTPGSRQVHGAAWSDAPPTPVRSPRLLAWSEEAGALLGASAPTDPAGPVALALGGNLILPGMRPIACPYGGHQFGHWAGQLGDGRAITLGETVADSGRWEIQLKGAGPTPYSRSADGRAVLRSSLREFVCSEAMFHLGVPTTRALALVATGEPVIRDMFYDGRPRPEPGAVVTRLAPTFVRFGNFELLASRGDRALLQQLVDFVVRNHYPELATSGPTAGPPLLAWFTEIARRTAIMAAHWMRVGFIHGVMNTDNMSVLGITIDYGPFGWQDVYDPDFTPNTTDAGQGRYRFGNQPSIAFWNVAMFARALGTLTGGAAFFEPGLDVFKSTFENTWLAMLREKLGLDDLGPDAGALDERLISDMLEVMTATEIDMSLWYRSLQKLSPESALPDLLRTVSASLYSELPETSPVATRLRDWLSDYVARLARNRSSHANRVARMSAVNPVVIPRNYLLQQAIDAAERGDLTPLARLMDAIRRPYEDSASTAPFAGRRPEWARDKAGCSALSCSS